jgi:surfactin family lipopeptide synthetase C
MLQDGWSFPLLMKDFFSFYNAFCQDDAVQPETIPPYSQYIAWLQQQDNMKARAFWQKMLHGLSLPPFLVKHQPGDGLPLQKDTYEKQEVMIPLVTTTGLQALARQHQLTLNTLLQGAWALFVSWQSGRKDVVFGTVVSGRSATLAGVESMVGFFNNILPVRAQISSETSLVTWLKELQAQQAEARQYEYSTLAAIRSAADLSPDQPLFESYLVFENFPFNTSVIQHLNHWNSSMIDALAQTEHPLRVEIVPGRTLWVSLSFYRRFFSPTTISSLLENFQVVLEAIVAESDQTLGALLQVAISRQSSQRRGHDGRM